MKVVDLVSSSVGRKADWLVAKRVALLVPTKAVARAVLKVVLKECHSVGDSVAWWAVKKEQNLVVGLAGMRAV